MCYFFEVNVVDTLEFAADLASVDVPDLYGATGRRRQRASLINKARMIDRVIGRCGSSNVILDTIIEGHRGFVASLMALGNSDYVVATQDAFKSCFLCAVHWDGGSYGGLNVNGGLVANTKNNYGKNDNNTSWIN